MENKMRKDKIELLAPAGDRKSFIGAINAGADAIYLSGKNYGARKYANNFSKEEIVELIEYAHKRGVFVYVTINTLIFEDEISELFEYSDFLVSSHVDAIIVQDIGVLTEFTKRYPDTEIHVSTQMNAYNIEQVKWLESIGVRRVILARETSIDIIETMRKQTNVDLEVFVHGALCVSYSGNCLFSSMNGGRSGNRGECAQPCRLKYRLTRDGEIIETESYLLSAKDLMTVDQLEMIVRSGVRSLKIEGRMRRPEYVIATVRAYREALDNLIESKDFDLSKRMSELMAVFNRDYTKGYLLNEEPYRINNQKRPNHQGLPLGVVAGYIRGKAEIKLTRSLTVGDGIRILGDTDTGGEVSRIIKNGEIVREAYQGDIVTIDLPKEVLVGSEVMLTLDRRLENSLNEYLNENYDLVGLNFRIIANVGDRLKVNAISENGIFSEIESDYIIEKAKKEPQKKSMLANQFAKFGTTFFYTKSIEIDSDESGFIPNGVINDLRRNIIEDLTNKSLKQPIPRIVSSIGKSLSVESREFELVAKVETIDQYNAAKAQRIKTIYLSEKLFIILEDFETKTRFKVMDRIWTDPNKYQNDKLLVIRDVGGFTLKKNSTLVADWTLNVTNSLSLAALHDQGITKVTLSPENTFENITRIITEFRQREGMSPLVELVVYGKTDLMLTKYCPITKSEGVFRQNCSLCEKNDYRLINEKNDSFRLVRDGFCNLRILHHKPLNLIDHIDEIRNEGVISIRLDFTDETFEDTITVIKAFQNQINHKSYEMPKKFYTYGRFIK